MNKKCELKKILYVEDDPNARFVVKNFINQICQLDLAENSDSALKLLNEKIYDIILMDINLKNGLNGIELTKEIRTIPAYPKTPIVAVTAFANLSDKEELLSMGLTHHISKPFFKIDLTELLENIIDNMQ